MTTVEPIFFPQTCATRSLSLTTVPPHDAIIFRSIVQHSTYHGQFCPFFFFSFQTKSPPYRYSVLFFSFLICVFSPFLPVLWIERACAEVHIRSFFPSLSRTQTPRCVYSSRRMCAPPSSTNNPSPLLFKAEELAKHKNNNNNKKEHVV